MISWGTLIIVITGDVHGLEAVGLSHVEVVAVYIIYLHYHLPHHAKERQYIIVPIEGKRHKTTI